MDPNKLIQDLCTRYGVPRAFGEKLRPLINRAQGIDPGARQRILDLVTRSFQEEGRRCRILEEEAAGVRTLSTDDLKVVQAVADVLHGWSPPGWLTGWGKRQAE